MVGTKGHSGVYEHKPHSKETRKKIGKANSHPLPDYHKKALSIAQQKRKERDGCINFPKSRNKLSKVLKDKWKRDIYFREKQLNAIFEGMEIKPNKPEIILKNLIEQNNLSFTYTGNGVIWFKGKTRSFNPDFISKSSKHIIELFGDYWHNGEDMRKRDIERLATYSRYGYKTLVIWEHELNNNPNQVIEKIRRF